jgi:hypothetical protein
MHRFHFTKYSALELDILNFIKVLKKPGESFSLSWVRNEAMEKQNNSKNQPKFRLNRNVIPNKGQAHVCGRDQKFPGKILGQERYSAN